MFRTIAILAISFGFAAAARAEEPADYKGPFPTSALYEMCSKSDQVSREKCAAYLQGMIYGVRIQKQMSDKGMAVCLPEVAAEQARKRVTGFIDQVTGGHPSNNKDGGDWIAFMALAEGNLCKKK